MSARLIHLCAHVSFSCCEGGLFFGIFALYGAWHLTTTVSFFLSPFLLSLVIYAALSINDALVIVFLFRPPFGF